MVNRHKLGKLKGFSLIELIIVIAILAIISVYAIGRFQTGTLTLASQLEILLVDIRYIQSVALFENKAVRINFYPATNEYGYSDLSGTPILHPTLGVALVPLESGVTFGSIANLPNDYVMFNSGGIPYRSTFFPLNTQATITLQSGSESMALGISPETGFVRKL